MITLITGCRSGFGLLTALEAARAGHTVYAGLRDLSTADQLRREADELPVIPVQLDVTNPAEREAAVSRVLDEQGRIDALVNNAGVALGGHLELLEEDELRKVFEVNVFAVWALTNLCLPAMRKQRSGRIVNVSSVAGRIAMPGMGAYAGSKFALEGMSESWRHELRPFGIHVCLVEPGPYKTDIFDRNQSVGRRSMDPESEYHPYAERMQEVVAKATEHAGDARDVARKIVQLMEQSSPPLRSVMGPSGKVRVAMKAALPHSVLEFAVGRLTTPK
ncbi:MAG: SDR family NAD(P)-dependent oxidoreductase [Alphaproteobacteria bacterium]|nr:SDR family NAD(P)-dependent oxidoreductase [Alphaproteobacteria bacterium]